MTVPESDRRGSKKALGLLRTLQKYGRVEELFEADLSERPAAPAASRTAPRPSR